MTQYLSQGVDYLGFLDAKLRDLQGYATLAHELIQNADDALATSMIFDVSQNGLMIKNNRSFSDCGSIETDECPWKDDSKISHRCDFHRFRRVAGGDKREQHSTIGAFGIGFISVYQITDRPELVSGRHHWVICPDQPEDRRIKVLTTLDTLYDGTCFILPWATNPTSFLRTRLRREHVRVEEVIPSFIDTLSKQLPAAILFLKHLRRLELRANNQVIKTIIRRDDQNQITITDNDHHSRWIIFNGAFDANALRQKYPQIESKRTGKVAIAIAQQTIDDMGRLYAFLPTDDRTGIPLHVNADFYPSTDRKSILFSSDYEGIWNQTAIKTAALLLANAIPLLPSLLDHNALWNLFTGLKDVSDKAQMKQMDASFIEFWRLARSVIATSRVVRIWPGAWGTVDEGYLFEQQEEEDCLQLLQTLNIAIVHPDLRRYYVLLRQLGIQQFGLFELARALRANGMDHPLTDPPAWIQDPVMHNLLDKEIERLSNQRLKHEKLDEAKYAIAQCAIARSYDGIFRPPAQLLHLTSDINPIWMRLGFDYTIAADNNPPSIAALIPELTLSSMLDVLEKCPQEQFIFLWNEHKQSMLSLFDWIVNQSHVIRTNDTLKSRLQSLPIWLSGDNVYSLDELVIPGDFEDILQSALVLDKDLRRRTRKHGFLWDLGCKQLSFQEYVYRYIPSAFASSQPSGPICRALVILLADNLGQLQDNPHIQQALSSCAFIECTNGQFLSATHVYMHLASLADILSYLPQVQLPAERIKSVTTLYEWLGVATIPRLSDIIEHIIGVVSSPQTSKSRQVIGRIFKYIGENIKSIHRDDPEFKKLHRMRWLPAEAPYQAEWYFPHQLYASYEKYLFESQACFLAIDRRFQQSDIIERLGINTNPTITQVLNHLRWSIEQGEVFNRQIYQFLNTHANKLMIGDLQTRSWVMNEKQQYVRPDHIFLLPTPFGRYRHRLHSELLKYQDLLVVLNIRDVPNQHDAQMVLKEIAAEFGYRQKVLDPETQRVVLECWKILNDALDRDPSLLMRLDQVACIPTEELMLSTPAEMLFDDRPGIAERFPEIQRTYIIPLVHDVWRAMETAGVRFLSKAAQATMVKCINPHPANDLYDRLHQRRDLFTRILDVQSLPASQWDLSILDGLRINRVTQLHIVYKVHIAGHTLISDPHPVAAYFDREQMTIYIQSSPPRLWAALAREVIFALNPQADTLQLVAPLKEILSANTPAEASDILSELGYAHLVILEESSHDVHPPSSDSAIASLEDMSSSVDSLDPLHSDQNTLVSRTNSNDLSDVYADLSLLDSHESTDYRSRYSPSSIRTNYDDQYDEQYSNTDVSLPNMPRNDSQHIPINRTSSASAKSRSQGRLRTYVISDIHHETEQKDQDALEATRRRTVDQAGIASVLAFEQDAGRYPQEMPHENPGYDIESSNATGTILRYIEVKSLSGPWGTIGVALTSKQFTVAQTLGDAYWLYVVEYAEQENRRIYLIQNPAQRVDQFFYDDGWGSIADHSIH